MFIWPSPGLVHYIYIFWGLLPLTEFSPVQNSLYVQVLCSSILTALQLLQGTPAASSAKLCGVVQGMELRNFHRGRHLYAAGRPSRWASAHIVVIAALWNRAGHYIFACGFFLLSSFFPSFTLSSRRLDVHHTSTHGVTLVRIYNAGMYRQSEKNFLNSNTSSIHVLNFGQRTAEIGSGVWGTPANFNGFRVLAPLLHGIVAGDSQTFRR